MDSKQTMTANESPQTLWSLLSDDADVSLPYNGSSGWSGTDTSKERADKADSSGRTAEVQTSVYRHLRWTGERGATWKEISSANGLHHGTVSGALSNLHKAERIARLTEKRERCRVYVLPEHVNGRDTDQQGRKHQCPECGHKF